MTLADKLSTIIMYVTVVIEKETGIAKLLDHNKQEVSYKEGMSVRIDRGDPFKMIPVAGGRAVDVLPLPVSTRLTESRIETIMTGSVEKFRADIKLNDETTYPTVAMWCQFESGSPKRFELILGGPEQAVQFPVASLGGHSGIARATPDTRICARKRLTEICLKPGKNVSGWLRIEEQFSDSLTISDLEHNWKEADAIMTRWAVKPSEESNSSSSCTLVLEAAPLGKASLDELPREAKQIMLGGACKSFMVWSTAASWFMPSARTHMGTTPGLYIKNKNVDPKPSDTMIRWYMQHILDLARRGSYTTGEDWPEYLAAPVKLPSLNIVPFALVLEKDPDIAKQAPTGDQPVGRNV